MLGINALVIIDSSGFVAAVNALSKRVIAVSRRGLAYRVLDHWWSSILEDIKDNFE